MLKTTELCACSGPVVRCANSIPVKRLEIIIHEKTQSFKKMLILKAEHAVVYDINCVWGAVLSDTTVS